MTANNNVRNSRQKKKHRITKHAPLVRAQITLRFDENSQKYFKKLCWDGVNFCLRVPSESTTLHTALWCEYFFKDCLGGKQPLPRERSSRSNRGVTSFYCTAGSLPLAAPGMGGSGGPLRDPNQEAHCLCLFF